MIDKSGGSDATNESRTKVRIRTDSGDIHEGYLDEPDLDTARRAINGQVTEVSISITLYADVTGPTNNNLQIVTKKLESVKEL